MAIIGIICDSHIRRTGAAYAYTETVKAHLADALTYLDGLPADAVIFGGDLVHPDGIEPPYPVPHVDDPDFETFLEVVAANWTKPYHAVPGNHDCPLEIFFRHFKKTLPRVESIGGVNFVLIYAHPGVHSYSSGWMISWVPQFIIDWLKDTLPGLAAPRVLVMHHPLIDCPEIKTHYELPYFPQVDKGFLIRDTHYVWSEYWIPLNRDRVLSLIDGYVEAVISGHYWQFVSEGYKTVGTVDVVYQKHFIKDDVGTRNTILTVEWDGVTLVVNSHDMAVSPPTVTTLLSKTV